jgi:two-component system chemotaxis response regulator CheY
VKQRSSAEEDGHPGRSPILLVEDDVDVRESLVDILLEHTGRTILTAANGAQALKTVHGARPCLILLDLMMPEMDGIEFLRRLSEDEERVFPVLVLSAHATVREAEVYQGVLGTLRKPFNLDHLLKWLDRICPADRSSAN